METVVQELKKAKRHDEFEDRLEVLQDEIVKAELCFYSFIAIHNFLIDHKAEGNKNPLFWNTIKDALLGKFLAGVGGLAREAPEKVDGGEVELVFLAQAFCGRQGCGSHQDLCFKCESSISQKPYLRNFWN